ncbi:MAG: hypothetical protein KGL39_20820 [Patescibacteria group bacterium]|nr:hypothetical protein [Patescibacteria group bacterium]
MHILLASVAFAQAAVGIYVVLRYHRLANTAGTSLQIMAIGLLALADAVVALIALRMR